MKFTLVVEARYVVDIVVEASGFGEAEKKYHDLNFKDKVTKHIGEADYAPSAAKLILIRAAP